LLAEGADRAGAYEAAFANVGGVRQRQRRHDRGRVIRDLAAMVANGGDSLSDLRAVRDQVRAGSVGRDSIRLIDRIANEPGVLGAVRAARSGAGARTGLGAPPEGIVIDSDRR
jgi:hypothetical protein